MKSAFLFTSAINETSWLIVGKGVQHLATCLDEDEVFSGYAICYSETSVAGSYWDEKELSCNVFKRTRDGDGDEPKGMCELFITCRDPAFDDNNGRIFAVFPAHIVLDASQKEVIARAPKSVDQIVKEINGMATHRTDRMMVRMLDRDLLLSNTHHLDYYVKDKRSPMDRDDSFAIDIDAVEVKWSMVDSNRETLRRLRDRMEKVGDRDVAPGIMNLDRKWLIRLGPGKRRLYIGDSLIPGYAVPQFVELKAEEDENNKTLLKIWFQLDDDSDELKEGDCGKVVYVCAQDEGGRLLLHRIGMFICRAELGEECKGRKTFYIAVVLGQCIRSLEEKNTNITGQLRPIGTSHCSKTWTTHFYLSAHHEILTLCPGQVELLTELS